MVFDEMTTKSLNGIVVRLSDCLRPQPLPLSHIARRTHPGIVPLAVDLRERAVILCDSVGGRLLLGFEFIEG